MISVVIPAYNEEKNIQACLDGLVKQKTTHEFEVILVDNNSTDKTVELAKPYTKLLNLTILSEKQKGRGTARYTGFEKAKGDIIFSSDSDTVVPPNWIEDLTNEFAKHPDISAVTGPAYINDCAWHTNVTVNAFFPTVMHVYRWATGHFWLSGFNFAIKKTMYEKAGKFNKKLNAAEDVDLGAKLFKIGKIQYIGVPVLFSGRRFQHGLIKGILPYVKNFAEFFFLKKKKIHLSDVR